MDSPTNGSTLPTGSVAIEVHAPAKTAARRRPLISKAEVRELAQLIAVEVGQALKRVDKLEPATGLSKTAQQAGAVAPVIDAISNSDWLRSRRSFASWTAMRCVSRTFTDPEKLTSAARRCHFAAACGSLWGAPTHNLGTGDWKLVVKSGAFGPRDDRNEKDD